MKPAQMAFVIALGPWIATLSSPMGASWNRPGSGDNRHESSRDIRCLKQVPAEHEGMTVGPPTWPEANLDSSSVRIAVVQEAAVRALRKIAYARTDVHVWKLFGAPEWRHWDADRLSQVDFWCCVGRAWEVLFDCGYEEHSRQACEHCGPGMAHAPGGDATAVTLSQAAKERTAEYLARLDGSGTAADDISNEAALKAIGFTDKGFRMQNLVHTILVDIHYDKVQRGGDFIGRNSMSGVWMTHPSWGRLRLGVFDDDAHNCEDEHGDSEWRPLFASTAPQIGASADHPMCYREEFVFNIEIPPLVFVDKQMWLGVEHRWARSAVEAVMYIILHEFAHGEGYLADQSKYPYGHDTSDWRLPTGRGGWSELEKMGKEEGDMDSWASSLMRADR
jgi:hypothetical protein